MAITVGNHAEVVKTNKFEVERPSTLAQNMEKTTSTTTPGIDEATENTNESEESSNFEETESFSDDDSSVPADKDAE